MKKIAVLLLAGAFALTATAQDGAKKDNKESQEIIIKKNGDKNEKITVVIDGENVTINGKPLSEFKDEDIKVLKRKSLMRKGQALGQLADEFPGMAWSMDDAAKPKAFLGIQTEGENEARIKEVTKGSAAEKAGLLTGDIITRIDDKKIENFEDVAETISAHKPKDEVTVYYKRDGKEKSAKAVLGENKNAMSFSFSGPGGRMRSFTMPAMPAMPAMPGEPLDAFGDFDMTDKFKNRSFGEFDFNFSGKPKLGLKIQDTEEGNGVKVLNVEEGSAAEKAGLKKDDVLIEIGGKKVTNTDEARGELHENADKNSYTIKAKRNGSDMSFEVKIPKKLKTTNL